MNSFFDPSQFFFKTTLRNKFNFIKDFQSIYCIRFNKYNILHFGSNKIPVLKREKTLIEEVIEKDDHEKFRELAN